MSNTSTTAKSFWDSLLTFSVTFSRFTIPDNFHLLQTFPSPVSHTDSVDTSTALLTCFNQYFTTEATVKLQQPGLSLQQQLGGFKKSMRVSKQKKIKNPEGWRLLQACTYGLWFNTRGHHDRSGRRRRRGRSESHTLRLLTWMPSGVLRFKKKRKEKR